MTDNRNIHSMLDLMGGSRQQNDKQWQDMGGKTPYRAVEITPEGSATLRVQYSNGDIEVLRYLYMSTILYGIDHDAISIHYPAGHVALYGKNLVSLIDVFEGEKARRVIPFDPNRHTAPKDGEPLIEIIRWWANDDPPKIGAK